MRVPKWLCPTILLLGLLGCTRWYVEPVKGGKWRSCVTRFEWDARVTGCGSPMGYDEALWWSETKGGKVR